VNTVVHIYLPWFSAAREPTNNLTIKKANLSEHRPRIYKAQTKLRMDIAIATVNRESALNIQTKYTSAALLVRDVV